MEGVGLGVESVDALRGVSELAAVPGKTTEPNDLRRLLRKGRFKVRLRTIEMERPAARKAFLEYRHALKENVRKSEEDEIQRRLDEVDTAVMRGYRELARGRQIIELSKTLAAGKTRKIASRRWHAQDYNHPQAGYYYADQVVSKLAIVRADAHTVWTKGVRANGSAWFAANDQWVRSGRRQITVPARTFDLVQDNPIEAVPAVVPVIPPPFRPTHRLGNYHLLFEADWKGQPAPADPALLKHLGGDLYAVLAVWDLSPLEAAVLGQAGRR